MASNITELATGIAKDTEIVNRYFEENNLPKPSFAEDGPISIRIPPSHPEVFAAHTRVLAGTRELHELMRGPTAFLKRTFLTNDMLYHHFVYHFDVAKHVPTGGEISYEDLSTACGVDVLNLKRFLRYAMTDWCFKETRTGYVGHTAASRALMENHGFRASVGISVNEGFRASASVIEALEKYPQSEEPIESGWAIANRATQPMFHELALRHPHRAKTATDALDALAAGVSVEPLFACFDFSSLGESATVVDVGGSHGPVSVAIAKKYPSIKCIVQDLPEVVKAGDAKRHDLPEDVKSRVSFQAHDMFEEQPVKGADAYFYRAVFHNWSDKYGIKMLKALIPALKKGAKIILNDAVMPDAGTLPFSLERNFRARDLNMLTLFNAHERVADDWQELFARADKRFKFEGIKRPPPGSGVPPLLYPAMIEITWTP